MVGPVEPDHLVDKGLYPIIGWISKGDGQIDLPERHGLLSRHDAMERRPSQPDARPVDAHGIERLSIHDVEAATSIHQYLGEPGVADDRIDDERVLSGVWDIVGVVLPIEGDRLSRPVKVLGSSYLNREDLQAFPLSLMRREAR